MLEKTKCQEIILVTTNRYPIELKKINTFSEEGALTNIYYLLLYEFCQQNPIRFKTVTKKDIIKPHKYLSLFYKIYKRILQLEYRRKFNMMRIFLHIALYNSRPSSQKDGILFYNFDNSLIRESKVFLKNNYMIFLLLEDSILAGILKKIFRFKYFVKLNPVQIMSARILDLRDINAEFSLLSNIKTDKILIPYLTLVVAEWIPRIYGFYKQWSYLLRNNKIKYVVLTSTATLISRGLVSAAKLSESTKSVLISHGDAVFDNPNYDYGGVPLYFSDYFFTSEPEWASYYKQRASELSINTTICINSNRLRDSIIKKKKNSHLEGRECLSYRKRVLYVPGFFMINHLRIDGAEYTSTWYYRFQRELIIFFSELKDYDFIWKGTLSLNGGEISPLQYFIKEAGFKNVFARTDSLLKNIKECDLFFTDNPTTSFYQAAINQLPVLGAYREGLKPRGGALKLFGRSLICFKGLEDLKPHLIEFLTSDPAKYKIQLELTNNSLISELLKKS